MVCNVKMRNYFLAFIVALGAVVTGYFVIWFTRKGSIVTVSEMNTVDIESDLLMQSALTTDSEAEEQISAAPSALAEVVPTNVLAEVGTVARFNCTSTNGEPVYWGKIPHGSAVPKEIHIGEEILVHDYANSGRFSVDIDITLRRHDLVINDTKQSDAGFYICTAERGSGQKTYVELVVWATLTCQEDQPQDSYMGDNVFDLKQDAISFTCKMNYWGNVRPQFIWSEGERKLNGTQGTESGIASSSLSLAAMSTLDGVNVTCEAAIRDSSSEDTRTGVLWTSDTIRVKYAVFKKEQVKECPDVQTILHCSPPCSYKLETVNGTQRCAVNYSAGAAVERFYIYQSSGHNSETDTRYLIATTALAAVSCFVLITLALRYLIKKLSLRSKMTNKNTEKKLLNNDERQNAADNL